MTAPDAAAAPLPQTDPHLDDLTPDDPDALPEDAIDEPDTESE